MKTISNGRIVLFLILLTHTHTHIHTLCIVDDRKEVPRDSKFYKWIFFKCADNLILN